MANSIAKLIGYNNDIIVDAPFILNKEITLQKIPRVETERVFLNGLLLKDDCYSLLENVITINAAIELIVGDDILVRYLS